MEGQRGIKPFLEGGSYSLDLKEGRGPLCLGLLHFYYQGFFISWEGPIFTPNSPPISPCVHYMRNINSIPKCNKIDSMKLKIISNL